MKNIFTLLLSLATLSVFSQPTLTSSWVPSIGLQTRIYAFDGTSGLSEGPSGASQTWDLSSYDTTASQVAKTISPSSAPGSSSFAGATDCAEGLSTAGNNSYTFNKLSGNTYQLIGLSQPTPSAYITTYTDPQDIFHFPETYNSSFTDVARITGSFGGSNPGTIKGTTHETVTADAYGTLTTKSGTFANVLRFKVVQDIVDTESVAGQTVQLVYHYETYNWVSPTIPGVILASVSHLTQSGISQDAGYYAKVISTGEESLAAAGILDWSIAPQPSSDRATVLIQSDKAGADAELIVYDLTGRQILQSTQTLSVGHNKMAVDVSALTTGIYMASIRIDGKSDTQQLVVRH
jgi:hypothetical protein